MHNTHPDISKAITKNGKLSKYVRSRDIAQDPGISQELTTTFKFRNRLRTLRKLCDTHYTFICTFKPSIWSLWLSCQNQQEISEIFHGKDSDIFRNFKPQPRALKVLFEQHICMTTLSKDAKESIFSIQVNDALAWHNLGPFEPVEV
jgi:hypothetical protein